MEIVSIPSTGFYRPDTGLYQLHQLGYIDLIALEFHLMDKIA